MIEAIDEPVIETEEDAVEALHTKALEEFRICQDRERDNRDAAMADVKFARLGIQWDEELKRQRERDGRPCLTINKLPPFIRQVVNDARQNKPQIKVLPQDSMADPKTAEIMSGLIRNIESSSDADTAYDTALEHAATGGFGYFRLNLAYADDADNPFAQDIVFERVANPFTVYGDPYSDKADSSDWNTAFVTQMMPRKAFEAEYGDIDADDWPSDKWPAGWREGDQVMVAEYWVRDEIRTPITRLSDGQVMAVADYEAGIEEFEAQGVVPEGKARDKIEYEVTQYFLSGKEVLGSTPWAGKYIPIVPVYGEEVNVDGERHFRSLIRDAKDAQVMYNAWRTASTELVALAPKAPFIGEEGAFSVDQSRWETANNASHPYIEYKKGSQMPQRQPFTGVPAGALQEALNAADDMKSIIGIYDAGMGARSNETSGTAINARARESDTSTFHFIDNLSRAIRHGGRILIDLIPKVYSAQRIIRILGEKPEDVQTVRVGSQQDAQARAAQQAANPNAAYEPIYVLGLGKYDLTVSPGPSFTTRREETATQMVEMMRSFPQAAPIIGPMLARNLDWPGADEIAQQLEALQQQQMGGGQAQPDPAQQAEMQRVQMELQAKQAEMQAQSQLEQKKLQVDMFKAETDRMKVQHEMRQPVGLPAMPFPARG